MHISAAVMYVRFAIGQEIDSDPTPFRFGSFFGDEKNDFGLWLDHLAVFFFRCQPTHLLMLLHTSVGLGHSWSLLKCSAAPWTLEDAQTTRVRPCPFSSKRLKSMLIAFCHQETGLSPCFSLAQLKVQAHGPLPSSTRSSFASSPHSQSLIGCSWRGPSQSRGIHQSNRNPLFHKVRSVAASRTRLFGAFSTRRFGSHKIRTAFLGTSRRWLRATLDHEKLLIGCEQLLAMIMWVGVTLGSFLFKREPPWHPSWPMECQCAELRDKFQRAATEVSDRLCDVFFRLLSVGSGFEDPPCQTVVGKEAASANNHLLLDVSRRRKECR